MHHGPRFSTDAVARLKTDVEDLAVVADDLVDRLGRGGVGVEFESGHGCCVASIGARYKIARAG